MQDFSIDLVATYMTGPAGSPQELVTVFGPPIDEGALSFVIISAATLFIIGTVAFNRYTDNLRQSCSYGRWIEYFLSSSVMIVLIAMPTGIIEMAALLAIFGVNAGTILFSLLQEKYERPGNGCSTGRSARGAITSSERRCTSCSARPRPPSAAVALRPR